MSREKGLIITIKTQLNFHRNVVNQLPDCTAYFCGRLQRLIFTKTQHLKMKYETTWNNSVTPEVLPTFEYYHVSHAVLKDIEFPALVLRARSVLDWTLSSAANFPGVFSLWNISSYYESDVTFPTRNDLFHYSKLSSKLTLLVRNMYIEMSLLVLRHSKGLP
jgi:hypothetical protein